MFNPAILQPLTRVLQDRDYTVTGTDVTLEQFHIAAEAGSIEAEVALIDATAGTLQKQESIRLLQQVRMCIPETRLIVLLPESDVEWQKALGTYGIYDLYVIDKFAIEDVVKWIVTRKTIADVPKLDVVVLDRKPGSRMEQQATFHEQLSRTKPSLPAFLGRFKTKRFEPTISGEIETQQAEILPPNPDPVESKNEDQGQPDEPPIPTEPVTVEEPQTEEIQHSIQIEADSSSASEPVMPVPEVPNITAVEEEARASPSPSPSFSLNQPLVIAVGGLVTRSGTTHTAIQAAYEASHLHKQKTALIEVHQRGKPSDLIYLGPEYEGRSFHAEGFDIYPACSEEQRLELLTHSQYGVLVLDLGNLMEEVEGQNSLTLSAREFIQSPIQLLALPTAPWDLGRWVRLLPEARLLLRRATGVLNFADPERLQSCKPWLSGLDSTQQNVLSGNPFTEEAQLLERFFEGRNTTKKKRRKWF